MAATITWEQLRKLAAFRASRGRAVSLYLDLDPSVAPTPQDVQTRVDSLLHEAGRRGAVPDDVERIRAWFHDGFGRNGRRGLALFVDGRDDLWEAVGSGEPVPDEVHVGDELYLAPLAQLAGHGEEALVAVVGRERGQVYKLEAGRLVEVADETDDVPGRHDQGGWSQARYERHIEDIVDHHLKRVAATLDRRVRARRGVRVVLVGTEETLAELEPMLAHETRAAVVGRTSAEAHAEAAKLLCVVRPVLDAWWAKREAELVDRWRAEAARNGRASSGWEPTLAAASDGRVDTLLVAATASRAAGIDAVVHKTLENGGTVQVVHDRRDLDPVGGLGALLRF